MRFIPSEMDAGAAVKGEACLSSDGYTSVSESEAERDAADQFEAAEAAALEKDLGDHEGAEELSTLEAVQRRKGRIDRLLGLYQKQQWRLLERVRVKHRKYYLRRGRSAAKPVKAPGASEPADEGVPCHLGVCEASKCSALVMPLAQFCVRHILLQPGQCLYVPDKRGLPMRRTGSERVDGDGSNSDDGEGRRGVVKEVMAPRAVAVAVAVKTEVKTEQQAAPTAPMETDAAPLPPAEATATAMDATVTPLVNY